MSSESSSPPGKNKPKEEKELQQFLDICSSFRVTPTFGRKPQNYDPYAFMNGSEKSSDAASTTLKKLKDDKVERLFAPATQGERRPTPHCKACTDFKQWMTLTGGAQAVVNRTMGWEERTRKECPLDLELLGRNTWSFLHTVAAYYPDEPTQNQQSTMREFIYIFSRVYPCRKCASHLQDELKTNIPDTKSAWALSQWFCDLHNNVNVRLGKPEFDCTKVFERWRDGWADGTCD